VSGEAAPEQAIAESWTANADAWTTAVRDGLIPSREAGTNAAILAACLQHGAGPVLDVGCGEGWLVHTVHPWSARGDAPYRSEWRTETFDAFAVSFPSPMPWYSRTLGSWLEQFALAGLRAARLDEPLHPGTGLPLSLLFHCEAV